MPWYLTGPYSTCLVNVFTKPHLGRAALFIWWKIEFHSFSEMLVAAMGYSIVMQMVCLYAIQFSFFFVGEGRQISSANAIAFALRCCTSAFMDPFAANMIPKVLDASEGSICLSCLFPLPDLVLSGNPPLI